MADALVVVTFRQYRFDGAKFFDDGEGAVCAAAREIGVDGRMMGAWVHAHYALGAGNLERF